MRGEILLGLANIKPTLLCIRPARRCCFERAKVKHEITIVAVVGHIMNRFPLNSCSCLGFRLDLLTNFFKFSFGTLLDSHGAGKWGSMEVQTRNRRGSLWCWECGNIRFTRDRSS